MKGKVDMTEQIGRLQENLHSIRKIAGWTAEDLGNKIGVTKQTISNIENFKVKLTQTQYIAIRAVLEYEVKENPKNVVLAQVIPILLDIEFEDEAKSDEIKKTIELIGTTSVGGGSIEQLTLLTKTLLEPLIEEECSSIEALGKKGVIGGVAGAAIGAAPGVSFQQFGIKAFDWLAPTRKNNKKKK